MIFEFFRQKRTCHHNKISAGAEEAYCPDCGELIKNKWYLVRCKCCGIKRPSHIEYGTMKPDTKYCSNCGSTDFYIQELEKISFIDVPYAILVKEAVRRLNYESRQIWVEKDEDNIGERKFLVAKT